MEINILGVGNEIKCDFETVKHICRCCLVSGKRMHNLMSYKTYYRDLAGFYVTESDVIPQWICLECIALLQKAVRFKHKILRAHSILYDYAIRCAPFPIDAQDPELSRYASGHLEQTSTLSFDCCGETGMGFKDVLQHEKQKHKSELHTVELPSPDAASDGECVKEEIHFTDYEDNMTLEEYRTNANKISDEDFKLFEEKDELLVEKKEPVKKKRKKKRKEEKIKKRKVEERVLERKPTIRKAVEVDPDKIRVITLNPQEQLKQREEESKAGLKFPFQCNLCYKGFNFDAKLKNHMEKHNPSRGEFECKLCHMYLPTAYSYNVHWLIHSRRYECVKCQIRMIDRLSIIDHYRSQHEGLLKLYKCEFCGKTSNNSKTHRSHLRNRHTGDRPKCDECGKTFVNKDSLTEHLQIHQGIKNYECSKCGKRFRTRTQIKHHQLRHTNVKDYYCVECDVRFKSAHSLKQHLQKTVKHKDKLSLKFPCDRCEKRFDSERRLQHHVSVQHEGVRSHVCAQCGAALATRNSLLKHIQSVHKGRRPPPSHVCDTCGKAFRGKSTLTNHVRTHTGEKPYECGECGRRFAQRTAMCTHIKLVHLKIRRSAKIKPELPMGVRDTKLDQKLDPKLDQKLDLFKDDNQMAFESWDRQCDVLYFVSRT